MPSKFVQLFLHTTSNFKINSDKKEKLLYLWNAILSSSEKRILQENISILVEYYSSFLHGIAKEDFCQCERDVIQLTKLLRHGISSNENAEKIFLKFLRTSINKLCEFSSTNPSFFLNCFFSGSEAVRFCENIYRMCTGVFENCGASDMINSNYKQLQKLIENDIPVLNEVVYCAAAIVVKMQLTKISENSLENICVENLFNTVLTLARRLLDIDINKLFLVNKKEKKIDTGTVAMLSTDIICCCTAVKSLNLSDQKIFKLVLEAEKLVITCMKSMDDVDDKRKERIKDFFGT